MCETNQDGWSKCGEGVLQKNDHLAHELRHRFLDAGVYVVNLVSSPGAGKTALLERTLTELERAATAWPRWSATSRPTTTPSAWRAAVRRCARSRPGPSATSKPRCWRARSRAGTWRTLDFLFIENVGNLVCPSSYDLGEDLRVVLFAVTEGEDKPVKYPTIYNTADLALITKVDIAEAVGFDLEAARRNIDQVRPGLEVVLLLGALRRGHGGVDRATGPGSRPRRCAAAARASQGARAHARRDRAPRARRGGALASTLAVGERLLAQALASLLAQDLDRLARRELRAAARCRRSRRRRG